MAEKYIKFTQNILGHDYAVGDIHGEFGKLYVALKAMGFDETKDRLFSVGDLVDRGCCSGEALHWLIKPWFFAVMADELDITVEQLIKRFICDGMRDENDNTPSTPSNSLDDFLVKNGVLKPK